MNRSIFAATGRISCWYPVKTVAWMLLFAAAFGLKYHYSHAGSDDLNWILKPTTAIVMALSDRVFVHETGTGFISRDSRVIVAPSCGGINFMIVALLMAGGTGISRLKTGWMIFAWLGSTFICVYGLTLTVNAIRIAGAIHLYAADIYRGWLTPARVHRLEGVGVYFAALCLFHLATQYILTNPIRRIPGLEKNMAKVRRPSIGWAPATWYVLVLLGIPLIRRTAARNPARFLEHGLTVIMGSALVLFVFFLIRSVLKGGHLARPTKMNHISNN